MGITARGHFDRFRKTSWASATAISRLRLELSPGGALSEFFLCHHVSNRSRRSASSLASIANAASWLSPPCAMADADSAARTALGI